MFSAFLLLFTGIYTMVYNLQSASVHFEYVLGSMSFVFLIIVPILTMRVLAEERRQKTDQLLYSLPLTMTQVVLGKFTAMLVVFAVPMAVICLYPVVLSAYGNVYLPAAYGAIVGFFFLWEMLQFFLVSREALEDSRNILRYYRHGILWRVGISLLAGGCISFFLSAQPLFTALLFLMFLVAECIFDMIFYRRFLKE